MIFSILIPAALFMVSCAVVPRYPQGQDILAGRKHLEVTPPKTLRAELGLSGYEGKNKRNVSGVLTCEPYEKYKLDVFGLPGMLAASFFWEDSLWTLVLYEEDVYIQGQGEFVTLPKLGLDSASVHLLFAYLWGGFVPRESGSFSRGDSLGAGEVVFSHRDEIWTLRIDPKTGLIRNLWDTQRSRHVEYLDYIKVSDRPLPKLVKFFQEKNPLLEIRARRVEDNPKWRRDPFFIRIPAGARQIETQRVWKTWE